MLKFRWPLFIFLISAILCLSFSAIYHLIGCVSKTYHEVLSRFDYGGISLLVTGSCFPPYYYFFYCEQKFSIFYLIFISTFGITTFCLSLTKSFNSPKMREFRGKLFLIFGLSAGIPIIHLSIVGDKLIGWGSYLCYWRNYLYYKISREKISWKIRLFWKFASNFSFCSCYRCIFSLFRFSRCILL